jgi:hypothetical protein
MPFFYTHNIGKHDEQNILKLEMALCEISGSHSSEYEV